MTAEDGDGETPAEDDEGEQPAGPRAGNPLRAAAAGLHGRKRMDARR